MRLPSGAWPRLPRLLRPRLRFPSPKAYPGTDTCFAERTQRPTRAPVNAPVSEMIYRLSVAPDYPWKDKDLPGYRAILFVRAVMQHPAGLDPSLPLPLFERINGEAVIAFAKNRTLGIRNDVVFGATYPRPTRSRAYASPASLPGPSPSSLPARAGSPLAGRDSHPLDNERNFKETSHFLPSQSTSSAWSHRRVARGSHPPRALARSGRGDFHHPAPPLMRLVIMSPRSLR
jgi:hypothetical protein